MMLLLLAIGVIYSVWGKITDAIFVICIILLMIFVEVGDMHSHHALIPHHRTRKNAPTHPHSTLIDMVTLILTHTNTTGAKRV